MDGSRSDGELTPVAAETVDDVGFATIVAPLDGSHAAERALPVAMHVARNEGAALVLVRVIPYPEPPVGSPSHGSSQICLADPPPEIADACTDATTYLERIAARYRAAGAHVRVLSGDPFTRVVAEIATWSRPLVVLTAHAANAPSSGDRSDLARRIASLPGIHVLVVPHEDASGAPRPLPHRH